MWGTKTFERLKEKWLKERESLQEEISTLKHQLLDAQAALNRKDQEGRERIRALAQQALAKERESLRERNRLTEDLKNRDTRWKHEWAGLRERHQRQVEILTRQIDQAVRTLEERETGWQAERIQLVRQWHEERDALPAPREADRSLVQSAVRAAEEQWRVEKAFLEGKISWLTERWTELQKSSEAGAQGFVAEFERMAEAVRKAAADRESQLRLEYEALVGALRSRAEGLEAERQKTVLEIQLLKHRVEQHDRAVDTQVERTDTEEHALRRRWEQERQVWQAAMEEKDQSWRHHVARLEEELTAWKRSWEHREQEVVSQMEELHRAFREAEAKWHRQAADLQKASADQVRERTLVRAEQSKAFRDRVSNEVDGLEAMAAEVERHLDGHPEKKGEQKETRAKLNVYREAREYIAAQLVEYLAKEGQAWEGRSPVETSIIKALETGRFALLGAQLALHSGMPVG